MTDVRNSRLSQKEGTNTTSSIKNCTSKVKKGRANEKKARDGSSSDYSVSESSSCETTGESSGSGSKPLGYHLVDPNDFEERAKRFLKTMPAERRREWLMQQGYSYNKDGMLVQIPADCKFEAVNSTNLLRKRSGSPRRKRLVKYGVESEDEISIVAQNISTNRQSGALERDNEISSNSTSHAYEESDYSSSSAEEDGHRPDNKSLAEPYHRATELNGRCGVESPNEIIKNRYARLVARMSLAGNGLPEFGDMETVVIPSVSSEDCPDISVKKKSQEQGPLAEANVDLQQQRFRAGDVGIQLAEGSKEDASARIKRKSKNLNQDIVLDNVEECVKSNTETSRIETKLALKGDQRSNSHSSQKSSHSNIRLSSHNSQKSSHCNDIRLSCDLREAYKPVVDDAIETVLGDIQPVQTGQCSTPNTSSNINESIAPSKHVPRDYRTSAGSRNGPSATRSSIPVKAKKKDPITMSTSTDNDDKKIESKSHNTSCILNRPDTKSRGLNESSEQGCEEKNLPSCQNEDDNIHKSEYMRCFESQDAVVTLKNRPQDSIETKFKSLHSRDSIAMSAIDCLNNINMQNANDNFTDYSMRLCHPVSNSLAHSEPPSMEEERIANLRKLVDKELVRTALKNSKPGTVPTGTTRSINESSVQLPDLKNKKEEDKNKDGMTSEFPCFVTGNKIAVAKKRNKVPKLVSVPPVQVKANKISNLSPAGNVTEGNVLEKGTIRKKSTDSETNETMSPASGLGEGSHEARSSCQRCEMKRRVSCVEKVEAPAPSTSESKEQHEVATAHLDGEVQKKKTDRQAGTKKNTHELIRHNTKENNMLAKTSRTNDSTKTNKESMKPHLPSIKKAASDPKNGVELTTKSNLKLPNITHPAQRSAHGEPVRGDPKVNSKMCAEKGFLPQVSNNVGKDSTVTNKSNSVHLPNVNKTTKESTQTKFRAIDQTSKNLNRNNEVKENKLESPVKMALGKSDARASESKLIGLLPGKLSKLENKNQKNESTGNDPKASNSSVSVDKRVQESFKQMEDEIQREIKGKLKHAKQTKTPGSSRQTCKPKTLTEKEKMALKSKTDALDDLVDDDDDDDDEDGDEDIDESAFLSNIVSDSQIAMYGRTKDTPLIRKIEPSAIDKLKDRMSDSVIARKTKNNSNENNQQNSPRKDKKMSYSEIKSRALNNAKQKALLTMAGCGSEDVKEDKPSKVDNSQNKSSNAVVAVDVQSEGIAYFHQDDLTSSTLVSITEGIQLKYNLSKSIIHDENVCGERFQSFSVDTLILEKGSYMRYEGSSRGFISTLRRHGACKISINSDEERDTNTNNSKSCSDAEDNCVPSECPSEGAYSTRLDIDKIDCWSSSLGASKEGRTRVSKKETRCGSRIPIRTGAQKGCQANKSSNRSTQNKSVSFQCDRIPQKLVVILNNRQGVKVGEAEAPIRFTSEEPERSIRATNSTIPEGQYTLEIRGESADPSVPETLPSNDQGNDGRKIPLSERLKKYQKSKPRNIHSGTSQRSGLVSERVLSGDIRLNRQNVSCQQNSKQVDVDNVNADIKNVQPSTEAKEGSFEDNNLIKKHPGTGRNDTITPAPNTSYLPNGPTKKTQYRPLLRPSPTAHAEDAMRSKNLMSHCELFSESSSIRTTQDHEDDIPMTDTLDKYRAGFLKNPTETRELNQISKQGDAAIGSHVKTLSAPESERSPNQRSSVPQYDKAHNSIEYEPTPDIEEGGVLRHEEILSQQRTPETHSQISPVYDVSSDEDFNVEVNHKSRSADDVVPKVRKKSWMGIEDSPAKFEPAEEQQKSDRQSNSSKHSRYRETLALTPLQHRFSDNEVVDKPETGFLQLIHKKVEHHFFEKLKDTPVLAATSHEDEDVEANGEMSSVFNSQETVLLAQPLDEQCDEAENTSASSEAKDEEPDGEAIYSNKTNLIIANVVDDSADKTFSIVNEKRQREKIADSNGTDIDNTSLSDYPITKPEPDNKVTKLSQKIRTQQIAAKRLSTGLVPTPASSSPIRSIQSKRPKGNLFDKVAFTSDESSGANDSAHGPGLGSRRTLLANANKNDSRMSQDLETLREKFSSNCEQVKQSPKLCQSRGDKYVQQARREYAVGDPASSQESMRSFSRASCAYNLACKGSFSQDLSQKQADHIHEPVLVGIASANAQDDCGLKLNAGCHSPDEIKAEALPWMPTPDPAEDTLTLTLPDEPLKETDYDVSATDIKKAKPRTRQDRLPPLSKRQSGLPHRPKVKRHY